MALAGDAGVVVSVAGRSVQVPATGQISVGRDEGCDLVVDHPLISRHHAVVRATSEGWVIEDTGSRNGIYLGSERVPMAVIRAGVVVRLGAEDGPALEIGAPSPTSPTSPPPPPSPPPPTSAPSRPSPPTSPPPPRADGLIRVGRADDNDVVLTDDLLVSRYHAELRGDELVDLGSHNGVFVNGQRTHRAHVTAADVIGIGQRQFRLSGGQLREAAGPAAIRFAAAGLVVRSPAGAVLLDHVNLALKANGLLAVVGPSGAGKSTLLNALTGFRPADEGTVSYDGRDLYAEYDDLRRRIGLVPQDDVLHVSLTVRQALEYAAELRFPPEVSKAERRQRVDEVMRELGLTERAHLQVSRLSGGQRKRTSVAVELLTKPSLLFLDEPTSGLDPGYERSLMQLLRDLADSGRTIIVVTHSVSSLYLCDEVLVLAPGGRPAYLGPPGDGPAFFGRDDYQGVFQALTEDDGMDWPARFRATQPAAPIMSSAPGDVAVHHRLPRGGLRQWSTLTRRYLQVIKADRVNLALIVAQAPVLGILQLLVMPRHELGPPASGTLRIFSSAGAILLNPVQIATALGLANAIRELVKERGLFRRERAAGLSIPAYLASKVAVLGLVAIVQSVILVAFTLVDEGGPLHALALGSAFAELTAVIALTGIAAMTLGLLISALSSTENLATTLLPIVIVVQNVLSMGGLTPQALAKPVLNQAQYASSAQWGFSAAAATADLNRLQGLSAVLKEVKNVNATSVDDLLNGTTKSKTARRFRHDETVWVGDMAALAALAIAALLASGVALARLDPVSR